MKKSIMLLCVLLVSSLSYSQILTEDFDYATGTNISSTPAWNVSLSGGINPISVTSPGLTFPYYAGSGIGNAVRTGISGEDDSASFARQDTGTTTSLFVSFMLNVTSAQSGGGYFFLIGAPAFGYARVFTKSSGSGYLLGIKKGNEANATYRSTIYNFNQTYLIIDKYKFISGPANDQISLFVFDNTLPITEPVTPDVGPVMTGFTDAPNLSRILIKQAGSGSILFIDGINVDQTWNNNVLPAELTSFTSIVNNRDVSLNWTTASELNNSGYEIERSDVRGLTSNEWIRIGNVTGNGTTNSQHSYIFTDGNLASGKYNYRLRQIDFNGNFEYSNLNNEVNIGTPSDYSLSQNYPNPFNPTTTIEYGILSASANSESGYVSLKIYDISGKEVMTLVNEQKAPGFYTASFNASNMSSGTYYYTLKAGDFVSAKKMTLLK
ncbi:MAG: T9SS type A sorting domain-containing protein [Bacteroidetes bacterium]|nr:T9SS type A sorting domain-containing protein [Bacteroidota bacterium]